jgi:transcriptional regulator with XRE-family HTH domain
MTEKEDYTKKIGDRIKKIREWRHIYPGELAKKINASPSFITRMEQGEAIPSLHRLFAIARELHVKVEDLFSEPTFEHDIFRKTIEENSTYTGKMKDYEYGILVNDQTFSPNINFHPYLIKYKRTPKTIYHQHKGWELLILRSGQLKMIFRKENIPDEREEYLQNPFDIVLFNSELWHAYIPDGEEAETLCIITDTAITTAEIGQNVGMLRFE